ncbi:MAG: A24 family peptidase [Candidatus Nanoarchaeia archaeon]|nr:A24 family peptidase [Candidatus Nanoarchaeia archaeon]
MITGIILVVLALLVLIIATYTDFKTGEIPDWLSCGFIISALGIRVLHSIIYSAWLYTLYGIMGFAAMYVFGILIYYSRQWGGGDAKIAMGLGAAFATPPFAYFGNFPYLLALTANIFIAGGIYGMLWSIYVFIRRFKKAIKAVKEEVISRMGIYIFGIALVVTALIIALFSSGLTAIMMFYASIVIFAYFLLFMFIKGAEKAGMYEKVPVSKLTEGDWAAEEIKHKEKIICSKKDCGLTLEQIAALKKAKVKTVLVKRGIKFLLAILAGTVITLIYGNMIIFALF